VVSLGEARANEIDAELDDGEGGQAKAGEIFGLWVHPAARGSGVATELVRAGARQARDDGRTHVAFWVSTDNGPAVAFASGMGFRPTDFRRPMNVASQGRDPEVELAMVLPLGEDFGPVSNL
jgi:ribosomal protein S18 acetylase RimI-like enzyme